jgi:hypothetical protein
VHLVGIYILEYYYDARTHEHKTAVTVTFMPSAVRARTRDQVCIGLYICAFEWGSATLPTAGISDMIL